MNQNQLPWWAAVLIGLVFASYGAVFLFFTDHILDWQIKLLQSRRMRRFNRAFGLIFFVFGIVVATVFLVGSLFFQARETS